MQSHTKGLPRLILFAGHAGTGKTTLAKKALPLIRDITGEDYFFLDKDTVYGQFSAHIMDLNTGNPNDRDSPYYLDNLRDWEYSGLIDIVRENLALNVNVILIGPFSREIESGKIFNPQEMNLPEQTHVRIAWIDLNDNEAKRRMQVRADTRDEWKLNHWDQYLKRRISPPENPLIQRFDNTQFDQGNFDQLIKHLIS